jgi:hypothetical protein
MNAKVGTEDTVKSIVGNESSREIINDNRISAVNIVTSLYLNVKSTTFPYGNIHKYNPTSTHGKTHNQIDHVLTDKRWH